MPVNRIARDMGGRLLTQYTPDLARKLLEHTARGGSLISFLGEMNITRDALLKMRQENAEFRDAIELAEYKEFAFWEKVCLEGLSCGDPYDAEGNSAVMTGKDRVRIALEHMKLKRNMHFKERGEDFSSLGDADNNDPTLFGADGDS